MITFTQYFRNKLDVHTNKERSGQLHLTLPVLYMQAFMTWMVNPLEEKKGIFRLTGFGPVQLNFAGCSIERQDGEDVFTIKVGDYDFINDEDHD